MKVSILAAVFNEELHLEEMVASVQAQDHSDWELLLVDDGSTDKTLEVARRLAAADSRLVVLGGHKIGKVAAFNLAFEHSSGDIVILLAGDDTLTPTALRVRVSALPAESTVPAVAYFKLRTFSEDPKFDGAILPRGTKGSRSGGLLTMNRCLASIVFPIPDSLPSEDVWLGAATEDLAAVVVDSQTVVLNYRVHSGNSHPRQKSFEEMTRSLASRHRAWLLLMESDRLALSDSRRERLALMWQAETHRQKGEVVSILRLGGLPWADRLGMAAAARPTLFRLRTRFYKVLSGRRGA